MISFSLDVKNDVKWQPVKAGKVSPAFTLQSMSADCHFYTLRFILNAKIQLDQRNKAPVFPLQHHKLSPHENKFCHRAFSLPRVLILFSANCLISLICSNRMRLSVFSGQTFLSTGGVSQCTFHLFLMADPSGIGLMSPLPLAHFGLSLHSPPPRVPSMVRVNGLKLRSSFR